jgi:NADH-quinone oxidoreductase subunit N
MPVAVTLPSLQEIAASNQWAAIMPELLLAGLAVLVLGFELVVPKAYRALIPAISISGLAIVLLGVGIHFHTTFLNEDTFAHLLHHSDGGQFMRVFFLLTAILVCLLATITLERQPVPKTEFYHLVIVITAALMLLAQSNHFVMFFVALETVTVGFYILVSYFRTSAASLEGGLKYLILSALSSAILLFGIVLLYGVAGNRVLPGATVDAMNFGALRGFLAANPDNFLANVGAVLVLAGIAFKIGAVPFQFWIPDVYQGAPTPVTAFLAVGSKAAGFAVLLILALDVFRPLQAVLVPVLSVMAVATILFGNLAALTQNNVKRLMGLSGVSHAGYLLVGVIAAYREPLAVGAVYFYLLAYLLASFAVFAVMAHVSGGDDADQDLEHYANLARERPFLGTVLAIGLGSLAGIPPLAGFMGKLLIFIFAFKAGLYGLLTASVVGVVISIYYYFGWIRAAFFPFRRATGLAASEPSRPVIPRVGFPVAAAMVLLAAGSVVLGFYQGPLGVWLLAR